MENPALIKFGKLEHLEVLRDKGELYMSTLDQFWAIEDDELRGDPCDSVDKLLQVNSGIVELVGEREGEKLVGRVVKFTYHEHTSQPELINLFCMYAMRPAFGTFPIDQRNFRFGDHALILIEPQKFIDRTRDAVKRNGWRCKADLVEYVGDDYSGEMGPFRKRSAFRYQSEWRMVVCNGPGKPVKLKLGSIAEISKIVRSDEINSIESVGS